MKVIFGLRKRVKTLELKLEKLELAVMHYEETLKRIEAAQRAESYQYGTVILQDLVKIVEKIPSENPTAKN